MHQYSTATACLLYVFLSSTVNSDTPDQNATDAAWKRISATIGASIDISVDPCEDFYHYACGNFIRNHKLTSGQSAVTSLRLIGDKVTEKVGKLLNDTDPCDERPGSSVRKLVYTYRQCLNESGLEILGVKPLADLIKVFGNTTGGWPLNKASWRPENFSIERTVAMMRAQFRIDSLLSIIIGPDGKNTSSSYMLNIDQAALSLGSGTEQYYLSTDKEDLRKEYVKFIAEILEIILKNLTITADVKKAAEDILTFEKKLAQQNSILADRRDRERMYNKMNLADLQQWSATFNWTVFVETLTSSLNISVDEKYSVIVLEKSYVQKLVLLLQSESKETVANYLYWQIILAMIRRLDLKVRHLYNAFFARLGKSSAKDRWSRCLAYLIGELGQPENFGYAVGHMFVKDNFPSTAKQEVAVMVENLFDTFGQLMASTDWMSPETRERGKIKLDVMRKRKKLGYPDYFDTPEAIDNYYHELPINKTDSSFDIHVKLVQWMSEKELANLGIPYDPMIFGMSPAMVNAINSPVTVSIALPAAVLQEPLFHELYPKAVNYGAIGTIIGHELTHGFDDKGSQYDADGNIMNWWSNDSMEQFKQKRECIINQYSNFSHEIDGKPKKVQGLLTQGENIGDNGGIREAFMAYQTFVQNTLQVQEEQRLPGGLKQFPMEKVFFLSAAQAFCENLSEKNLENRIMSDPHAPGKDRINGIMQNFEEFSRVFECEVGSPMNPEKKCRVW